MSVHEELIAHNRLQGGGSRARVTRELEIAEQMITIDQEKSVTHRAGNPGETDAQTTSNSQVVTHDDHSESTSIITAVPTSITHAMHIPETDSRIIICRTMDQLNHPRPSRHTIEEIHNMTDAQLTGTIAGAKRRAGAKRKHRTEYDATDRVNEQITQHGRPTTRRRTTYRWRKDDLARYIDFMETE